MKRVLPLLCLALVGCTTVKREVVYIDRPAPEIEVLQRARASLDQALEDIRAGAVAVARQQLSVTAACLRPFVPTANQRQAAAELSITIANTLPTTGAEVFTVPAVDEQVRAIDQLWQEADAARLETKAEAAREAAIAREQRATERMQHFLKLGSVFAVAAVIFAVMRRGGTAIILGIAAALSFVCARLTDNPAVEKIEATAFAVIVACALFHVTARLRNWLKNRKNRPAELTPQ